MNAVRKILSLCLICLLLAACGSEPAHTAPETTAAVTEPALEVKDWAASIQPSSDTLKQEVTVRTYIDGDTTHFNIPEEEMEGGVIKARYLAVNTPESTGRIEEYGKAASRFTRERLENAESILIESEDDRWNSDSTGDRYLVWVWYKPKGSDSYRNLNIELLQEGLAIANSSANNRYGDICMAAIAQARAGMLNVHSKQPDPDFYYGEDIELTLRELRCNIESYAGKKVAFEGVITVDNSSSIYIEALDPETERYYGISAYYGFNLNGKGLEIVSAGNKVRIVGTVQYYEAGGIWQVSDLNYRVMKPEDPNNIQMLSQGHSPAYTLITPETFISQITVPNGEDELTAPWAQLALGTSVEMQNLTAVDAYTSDDGAITLTCVAEDKNITIRTAPLRDENGERITQEEYLGKTIDVKGIVDFFDGGYQIKVFTPENITIK